MPFPFAIRKLKKILTNEQTIAARGADRFAKARVVELKEAIERLSTVDSQRSTVKQTTQQKNKPKPHPSPPDSYREGEGPGVRPKPKTQLNLFN